MEPVLNKEIDEFKCYACGKTFQYKSKFERHKNKKTPCLIREVAPDQLANPNRCIYCNKIMANSKTLTKHFKTCKIKNGGMDILDEKVRHEQEIRILKEHREADAKQIAELKQQLVEQNALILEKLEKLEKQTPTTVNTTNNTVNNNTVNITLNHFQKPNLDGITLTEGELIGLTNLPRYLFDKVYCNPDKPENHTVYKPNKKEERILFHMNNNWQSYIGPDLKQKLLELSNASYFASRELVFGPKGLCPNDSEEIFLAMCGAAQNIILNDFQKRQVSHEDITESLLCNREMIEDTKKVTKVKPIKINSEQLEVICSVDDL